MEEIESHISEEGNASGAMQYLQACLREDYKGDKGLLKRLADNFKKENKPEWKLTCYYLLDD